VTTPNIFEHAFARIHAAANAVAARERWNVLLFSHRRQFFDPDEFSDYRSPRIEAVQFAGPENFSVQPGGRFGTDLPRRFDIGIVCNNNQSEHASLFMLRQLNLCDFLFVWTWDNHHNDQNQTLIANPLGDVIVPAHWFCADYMKSTATVLGRHVPLATAQWSRAKAARFFQSALDRPRDDALHGGFMVYSHINRGEREDFTRALQAKMPGHALRLIEYGQKDIYFGMTAEERWHDWARHKAGLILPLKNDLGVRFFDSLTTGQVPIVPRWCRDFDLVITPALQQSLPVVRLEELSVAAGEAAWREAVARFDQGGSAGALRRHRFALENHHLVHRVEAICAQLLPIAARQSLKLKSDSATGVVLD
jgi:hypothetical protein